MRRFVEQRAALKAQIAEASRTLLPLHPRMKELTAQLAGLDGPDSRRGGEERARVRERRAACGRSGRFFVRGDQGAIEDGRDRQRDDVRLRALEMDAKAARDQLESYLQKYREAAARDADSGAPADARVIATAEPPRTPTFPKVWQTILLATLAAFVVSIGVAAAAALASGEPESDGARAPPPAVGAAPTAQSAPRVRRAPHRRRPWPWLNRTRPRRGRAH